MSTQYPANIDTFVNPISTDSLTSPDHAVQHSNINDAVKAIQIELGTNPKGSDSSLRARLLRLDNTALIKSDNLSGLASVSTARSNLGLGTLATQSSDSVSITGGTISGTTITGLTLSGLGSPLAVADGGTGSTSASSARTALGLGSIATQASSSVSITGGSISGVTLTSLGSPLAIASGGTGGGSASAARTALGLGSMSTQDASNITVTGGSTNNLSTFSVGTSNGLDTSTTGVRISRVRDAGTTSAVINTDYTVARVENSRTVTGTVTNSNLYGLNIYCDPVITGTGLGRNFGLFIQGAPSGAGSPDLQAAIGIHWDASVLATTPLHVGISNHIGVVGGTITEARNMQIESGFLYGGSIIKSVGIRFNYLGGVTNWSILEPVGDNVADGVGVPKMHHMGPVHVGGSVAETAPSARFQVTEVTPGNEVMRLTTEATSDDPVEKFFQARDTTTDATAKNIWTYTISGSKSWFFEARVVARCTAGGPGGENIATYVRRATVYNALGSAIHLGPVIDEYSAESVASWDCTIATDFSLSSTGPHVYVRVTGAASTTITWHAHIRVWEVGA